MIKLKECKCCLNNDQNYCYNCCMNKTLSDIERLYSMNNFHYNPDLCRKCNNTECPQYEFVNRSK
jgi:hypothetical protein